jgi:hypothetical protein
MSCNTRLRIAVAEETVWSKMSVFQEIGSPHQHELLLVVAARAPEAMAFRIPLGEVCDPDEVPNCNRDRTFRDDTVCISLKDQGTGLTV